MEDDKFFSKWKTTAKPKLILGLAQLSKIFFLINRANTFFFKGGRFPVSKN
jgi:hypothetical protein